MKEIWKLIELFKEYVDKYSNDAKVLDEWEYVVIDDGQSFLYWTREYSYLTLISKKFWFVKWLVENEKIKSEWIKPRADLVKEVSIIDRETKKLIWIENQYTEVEQLLMYLSIQDKPIEFLASILK